MNVTVILPNSTTEDRRQEWLEKTAINKGLEVIGPITEIKLGRLKDFPDWSAYTAECREVQ